MYVSERYGEFHNWKVDLSQDMIHRSMLIGSWNIFLEYFLYLIPNQSEEQKILTTEQQTNRIKSYTDMQDDWLSYHYCN